MAVLRICALLLLFDCQEAFHCCLVVACINRINMISIECHRSGERCPGKREFDNRIEIKRVRSGEIMWLFPLRTLTSHLFKVKCIPPLSHETAGTQGKRHRLTDIQPAESLQLNTENNENQKTMDTVQWPPTMENKYVWVGCQKRGLQFWRCNNYFDYFEVIPEIVEDFRKNPGKCMVSWKCGLNRLCILFIYKSTYISTYNLPLYITI